MARHVPQSLCYADDENDYMHFIVVFLTVNICRGLNLFVHIMFTCCVLYLPTHTGVVFVFFSGSNSSVVETSDRKGTEIKLIHDNKAQVLFAVSVNIYPNCQNLNTV